MEQRRFSGPVRPNHRMALAILNRQIDAANDVDIAEALMQAPKFDPAGGHCLLPCSAGRAARKRARTIGIE